MIVKAASGLNVNLPNVCPDLGETFRFRHERSFGTRV